MDKAYLSVTQINNYIKNIFEAEILLQNICVYGEISSYNISGGIAYFNLKDESGCLPCLLFNAGRFASPKLGDVILATGSISYYAKGGKLSFNANYITPYGKGALYEQFLKLKEKLESLGYFAVGRKKEIPKRVKRIGVVTSETGAVIHDIIDITHRRNSGVDIVLFPVKVQGVGAENEIAKGIQFFSEYPNIDCIIVARGGGSLEDLQPFNSELVADAVFNCKKPLVSAVGHETDFTIIDFVADLRAPTPSAAAELVVNRKSDDVTSILSSLQVMHSAIINKVGSFKNKTENAYYKIENGLTNKVRKVFNNIKSSFVLQYYALDKKLSNYEGNLQSSIAVINKLNPSNMLKMGYTKIESDGKIISSVSQLNKADKVSFKIADGTVAAVVEEVKKGDK